MDRSPASDAGFSLVIDIGEGDSSLVPKTLPSWLMLGAPDVVLCVDQPISGNLRSVIESVARGNPAVRIVEVPQERGWRFRLALVRRTGFRAARFDTILTGDIDIVVNRNCLKAVAMVGKDDIGLVSLSKRRGGGNLGERFRNVTRSLLRAALGSVRFTGLYALYRPYWLDSEDHDAVMSAPDPRLPGLLAGEYPYRGEDAMLRDYMRQKHKVVYLPEVGGTDLRVAFGDRRIGQSKMGSKYFLEGRKVSYVLLRSMVYVRGITLGTYATLLARRRGALSVVAGYFGAMMTYVTVLEILILGRIGLRVSRRLEVRALLGAHRGR
jgi:hypothetical protein